MGINPLAYYYRHTTFADAPTTTITTTVLYNFWSWSPMECYFTYARRAVYSVKL